MEWEAPGASCSTPGRSAKATRSRRVMTAEHGAHRGLARGGAGARAGGAVATRQPRAGALGRATRRPARQLSAELVHPAAALAMDDALALAMLTRRLRGGRGRAAGARGASAGVRRAAATARPPRRRGRGAGRDRSAGKRHCSPISATGWTSSACAVTGASDGARVGVAAKPAARWPTRRPASWARAAAAVCRRLLLGDDAGDAGGLARRAAR